MTPRRPHLLLLPTLLLTLLGLPGCGQEPTATASDPATTTSSPPQEPTPEPTLEPVGDRLPDDLPLDLGMDRDDADATVTGPGREVAGVSFAEVCDPDPTVWPGPAVDRVTAVETGPEYGFVREALLYPSAADAADALDRVRALVEGCPTVEGRVYSLLEPTAAETLTVGLHYTQGLGGTVWTLVQHDDVVLVLSDSGEASEESLPGMAESLTRTHDELWAAIEDRL